LATLCRRVQGVPSDNDGAGPLIRVEPQQEIGEAEDSAAPLPSLRRMVFGNAWYDRWANESPSMTSNGRRESSGSPIARVWLRNSPPVRPSDFFAFGEGIAAAVVA
jgi:hypothetical protein